MIGLDCERSGHAHHWELVEDEEGRTVMRCSRCGKEVPLCKGGRCE